MNVYEIVTQRILEQLDKGIIPWRKPWQGQQAINYITRKPYHGINILLLDQPGEYLTFNQIKSLKGSVKKGAKSSVIVFYKMNQYQNENNDTGETEIKTVPILNYYRVFHISQTVEIQSKLEPLTPVENNDIIAQAQNVIDGYIKREHITLNVVQGSDRAFYTPSNDSITLPSINQFINTSEYYSTALHEAVHSTGHESRLNRISKVAKFGSETYSKEELTAEIGSAILMNILGIEIPSSFNNSVGYIQGWSKKLKDDVKAIVTASSQAQKAIDMILQ